MAKQVKVTNPYGLKYVNKGDFSGSVQGIIKARTGRRGAPKIFAGGAYTFGNPNPTYKFPKGQSGNPNY